MIRPISLTALTWVALGIAVIIAIFLIFGEYTRKTRLTGVLAPCP